MTERKPDNLVALHHQETGSYVCGHSSGVDGWALDKITRLQSENEALEAANRDLQDWFDDARATAEKCQARVAELEAALKEARANLHEWSDYVPEYFQEKHGLEQDLASIDSVLGVE